MIKPIKPFLSMGVCLGFVDLRNHISCVFLGVNLKRKFNEVCVIPIDQDKVDKRREIVV